MKFIIEKYKNNIRKIISNITGSINEDIEQEVYIKTWKNIDKYKEQGKFKSWINTITANVCRDYMKSSFQKHSSQIKSEEEELIQIKDEKETPESAFITKQKRKTVIKAINSLKPKLREVIIMYEMQELSYEEIAKRIKCPVGTIRSRLFNARKELSIKLKDLI